MICSMTGYAACTRHVDGGTLQLEIKSVNSRYLDFHFRVGEELRASEIPLRELFSSHIKRGKVECRLSFQAQAQRSDTLQLNEELLAALSKLGDEVRQRQPGAAPLSVNEILRWPGMFGEQRVDFAALVPEVLAAAREALAEFTASRAREGEKLANVLRDRVADMRAIVAAVAPRIPQAQAAFTEKLRQRLEEALGAANDERILQEVAVFATRIDVAEELTRLQSHLDTIEELLKKGGEIGKRLDFLIQELHREANTLGSKSASSETSRIAMDMKVLVEQMREQVQNIE